MMDEPTFRDYRPSPWFFNGHLQTIAALRPQSLPSLAAKQHRVRLPDGDSIVLHEDEPSNGLPSPHDQQALSDDKNQSRSEPSVLLVHGLCGCHGAAYMLRLAAMLIRRGIRTYRMDMRGCGAASRFAFHVTHAGRSDDCAEAMRFIASRDHGPLGVVGYSMGGNQALRMLGRQGKANSASESWVDRTKACVAVSPPIDLARCSRNMLRGSRQMYSRYFLKQLLRRVPEQVAGRPEFKQMMQENPPKTLWDLDDRLTAPLSGFSNAEAYYEDSSAMRVTQEITVPTLLLVAEDDPIVPFDCFQGQRSASFSDAVSIHAVRRGGHLGYVDRRGTCWMDRALEDYLVVQTGVGSISSATGVP